MISEAKLRDQLAENLSILEEGLTLIEMEHRLGNPIGSKGFVDILARDEFGNRVLIELKRSNAAARQALHELYKYIALFRISYGLSAHQIRCFVASTEWHELIVPFAEFARTADYQVEGFVLDVEQSGTIISASRVNLPELPEPQSLSTQHHILLFDNADRRDESIPIVERTLDECGAESFVIVLMKYEGDHPWVIYKSALYVVPGRIRSEIIGTLKERIRNEYELEKDCEVDGNLIESNFGATFTSRVPPIHDDYGIGYPDKFMAIQRQGWVCECIRRYGQWSSEAAATDEELCRIIAGEEGTNTVVYRRMSSPRLHLHWQDFQRQAELCLRGNEVWASGFAHFCRLAEEMSTQSSVTISIYNFMNWPLSLFKWIVNGERDYLPSFEAVVTTSDGNQGWALIGVTMWDGSTKLDSVHDLFRELCNDTFEFFSLYNMGEAWQLDAELMRRLGLCYQMVLFEFRSGFEPMATLFSCENGRLVTVPNAQRGRNLEEFVGKNRQFLLKLNAEISSVTWGL
jgi:hypothetical protein